ncbi:unnamed protein product [Prorocentrum cordatum]|nr:unnamed protein product [Polarella glacialis]
MPGAIDDVVAKLYTKNYGGPEGMWCVGINAVGFDLDAHGGRDGHYTAPDLAHILYFRRQGANCFRLPIIWERLQSSLGASTLDLVPGVADTVEFITEKLGAYVIIDPHNNDQGLQYNGKDARLGDFVSLWGAIAEKWGSNPMAIFGLYNEPRFGFANGQANYFDPNTPDFDGVTIETWRMWCQAALLKIREVGSTNLVLVPGLHWTGNIDWTGASSWGEEFRWGEDIDGTHRAGNTRLAAIEDPAENLAYDVHQYMDLTFGGVETGCEGHWSNKWCGQTIDGKTVGCNGANWGLPKTVEWAKKYGKKLMMTEIGSFEADDGTAAKCQTAMYEYLDSLNSSGVFIGYQVWQFGCEGCLGDQWSQRPSNLDWYRWDDFGSPGWAPPVNLTIPLPAPKPDCAKAGDDCTAKTCCADAGASCFEKNSYRSCLADCEQGVHEEDAIEFQTPWSCRKLY